VGWTHRNIALRPGYTVATETLWVTASVQGLKLALDLTRLGRGFLVRASPHSSFVAKLDRLRRRPEELVIFAWHDSRHGGEGGTSCRRPFPGCPGLSQSRSRWVFHAAALRLFYQGTVEKVRSWRRKWRVSSSQSIHRRDPVN